MNIFKFSISLLLRLLGCIFGWLFIFPLALFIPKKKNWVGVFGQKEGRFLDNTKYFFLQASEQEPSVRFVFITERRDTADIISQGGLESYCYPDAKSIWFLLRCSSFVVDAASWNSNFRFYFLLRANIIQLWHGVPFKWIELGQWKNHLGSLAWASKPLVLEARLFFYRLTGRWVRYAAVVTTSEFYKKRSFEPSFEAEHFPVVGYPRNDFAQSLSGNNLKLAWSNFDAGIKSKLNEWLSQGKKIVLVAPTFRDSGSAPMQLAPASLALMDRLAEENGIEFLFKFHPYEKNIDNISGRHFHVCDRQSDIYPIFPHLSALVTDYSSISMDFLFVDKPLLFLIPDSDDYLQVDRGVQFDPRAMMLGPVVPSWEVLLSALLLEWQRDSYKEERALMKVKAFDDLSQAEAVPQLLALMREQRWVE